MLKTEIRLSKFYSLFLQKQKANRFIYTKYIQNNTKYILKFDF